MLPTLGECPGECVTAHSGRVSRRSVMMPTLGECQGDCDVAHTGRVSRRL